MVPRKQPFRPLARGLPYFPENVGCWRSSLAVERPVSESQYELKPIYDPAEVESRWYDFWERKGFFRAEVDPGKQPFCIVIPPPNVTGNLHIGHALNNTIQDILIRWRRMQGYSTLWLPGTDHAGIATQAVVEKDLAKEGLTRQQLGRERFLERVWGWKERYESNIIRQLKRMGCSCDWSRTRFTMDEGLSRAVEEVFVRYYQKGLIYKGNYIVNWCPRCATAVSDLEVNHEPTQGRLWHILYPFVDGPLPDGSRGIVVATTRPETMLGDTAVAVHPDDDRYRALVGRKVRLPLVGREIPIVADAFVDPSFGSGAVKVTPAHDPNDFEIGRRHGLPEVQVIGFDARMTEAAGRYAGMDRYQAREAVVRDLEAEGWLVGVEEHSHAVGHCDRCDTVVEPLISSQWFVRMKPLVEPAIRVVRDREVRFVPERFTKIYIHWLENIRDWCISRQLWWGHRIPAWECRDCGETVVAREREAPVTCPRCGGRRLERDPDVLDTWFSSALWPFSTMGWPDETEDMRYFYPTDVLVTGYDIIFFWVARMVWSAMEFVGKPPFRHVLVTGLVRDHLGRKMSKSLGNGVDPLEVIERYGADTLRFTLVTGNTPGNDQRFHWEKVEGVRNFCNKIWNAARFVLANLEGFRPEGGAPGELGLAERWILSRLDAVVSGVTDMLDRFELGEAARLLYDFFWSEYCDWYIELAKPALYGKGAPGARRAAQYTLWTVLETFLRLLHPFMPFITEEIWQRLPHEGESVMVAAWPEPLVGRRDPEAEGDMALLMEATRAVRNLRAEMHVPPATKAAVVVRADGRDLAVLQAGSDYLKLMANLASVSFNPEEGDSRKSVSAVVGGAELVLPLEGLVDVEKEAVRLERELGEAEEELARTRAKLANPGFTARAPQDVVEKERKKAEETALKVERLRERLARLRG